MTMRLRAVTSSAEPQNTRITRATLLLAGVILLTAACGSGAPSVVGEYQDVSESEWVTVLRLVRDGSAVIEQSSWASGRTEATSITKISTRWSPVEPGVALRYRGRVDTLEYSQSWSAAEFGAQGEGPGLRPITPSEQSAFVGRLVLWRVEFLDSLRGHLP
jgi:hypothetical protein